MLIFSNTDEETTSLPVEETSVPVVSCGGNLTGKSAHMCVNKVKIREKNNQTCYIAIGIYY